MFSCLDVCFFTFSASEWHGLETVRFFNEQEKEGSRQLLELFEKHIQTYPGCPGETPLFLMLKGDDESLILANEMILSGNTRDALIILHDFPHNLAKESLEILKNWLLEHIKEGSWHWTRSTRLYNINWPLQACEVLILGGEILDNMAAATHGYEKLQEILDGIIRLPIGTVSEFNSPTYYGVDIAPLAQIANYTKNEEYKIKAMILEERLWLDLATRYNPNIGQLAGPFSRVYHDGLVGATSIARSQMYKVFSHSVYTQLDVAMEYPHYWDLAFIPSIAFQSFHCPDYIRSLAMDKKMPYQVCGTSAGDEFGTYPFSFTHLHTYITDNWTLGSNSRGWLDGNQNAACIAYWRRRSKVKSMRDYKVLVSRYQINDSGPHVASLEQPEMGRINSLQDKGTIIAAYKPKKRGDPYHKIPGIEDIVGKSVKSLRLDIQIPLYDDVDELSIGYRSVDPTQPNIEASWDNRVYIRDGSVFMGVRPLEPTNLGVYNPLRIRRLNEFLVISIYNLDSGIPKEFTDEELDHCKNGFIMEIASTTEYPDLNHFRNYFEKGKVADDLNGDIRAISYTNSSRNMTMEYNMVTEEFIGRAVNKQLVSYPLFSCPNAIISSDGNITLEDAHLETKPGTYTWLIADSEKGIYAGYNFTDNLVNMKLETPAGTIQADSIGFSKIVLRIKGDPTLEIWAARREGVIVFPGFPEAKVMLNGNDVTSNLVMGKAGNTDIMILP